MSRISSSLATSFLLSLGCVKATEPEPTATPTVAPVEDEWAGAPELDRVCEHIYAAALREPGVEQPSAEQHQLFLDKCLAELALEREQLGPLEYRRQAECVLAQSTIDAMTVCDPKPEPDERLYAEVCRHVLGIMEKEFSDAAQQPTAEEIEQFLVTCANEMERERLRMGDDKFGREAQCVLAATNVEQVERCDDE